MLTANGPRIPERPALLTVGMVLSAIAASLAALILLAAVAGFGKYSVEGEQVTSGEFLRRAGVLLVVEMLLLTGVAVGLFRRQTWARPLMLLFWLVVGAWHIGSLFREHSAPGWSLDLTWLVALLIAGWYLYFKPNVSAYFASSKSES